MTYAKSYRNATISVDKAGLWRFSWHNTHPDTGELTRVRKTFDINRIQDVRERHSTANRWLQILNEALRNGYNYFAPDEYNASLPVFRDLIQPESSVMAAPATTVTIVAAVERALKIRTLGTAPRTAGTYRSFVTRFCEWLAENDMHTMAVEDFSYEHWQEFLFYKSELGHGNRNLNDYTNFFKTTFDTIRRKLKFIDVNPLADADYLPERESSRFQPLTIDELQRIVPALIEYNPRFYLYTKFIAYQFIRPWHITRLKAGDINYVENYIHLRDETTKNKKSRNKQLLQPIKAALQELNCQSLPGNYYLFANANFEPGKELYNTLSIRAAEQWKRIVIDGLGIDKKMYALKHTSSQFYVNENENADLKFLQQHMEHHSLTQTEIYLQNKVFRRIDEDKTKFMDF